ncbi:transient receptor potential cation channel subfamily A member 1-like [Xenia sp. Carnegie-2017]|uniref:transient receptor potential cation channel subfamily A member 1-like n=1 Tax=Xenia sp. Carnegie-2017 TaxID=2897299 RepID=UPI001F037AB0|nr:transient receptor potential cation channel subfamily A member 1-like [Xenia sp. Carnegie-2017]
MGNTAMSNRSWKWTKLDLTQDTVNEPKDLALTPLLSIEAESETNIVERDDNKMKDINRMKFAVFNDDEKMINDILREKTSEREIQNLLAELDEKGRPCIFYAVEFRSLRALTCLLNQVKDTKCVTAKNGETVLHVATEMNDAGILKKLLDHDFVVHLVNDVESKNSRSPLFFAAMYNFVDVAKVLLEHGGNMTKVDGSNRSPLYIAAEKGRAGLLDLFLKHEKSRVKELLFSKEHGGKHHQNILHVVVDSGDESTVEVCLQQDEDMIRSCLQEEMNSGGSYLVDAVRKNGLEEILSRFIDTLGDSLVQQNKIREEPVGDSLVQHAAIIEEPQEALPVQHAMIIEEPVEALPVLVQHATILEEPLEALPVQHAAIIEEPVEALLVQHAAIIEEPVEALLVQHAAIIEEPVEALPVQHAAIIEEPVEALLVKHATLIEESVEALLVQHAAIIEESEEALPVQHAAIIEEPVRHSLVPLDEKRKELVRDSLVQHDEKIEELRGDTKSKRRNIREESNFNHLSDEIPHNGQASPTCPRDRYAGFSHRALLLAVEGGHVEDVKEFLKENRFVKRDKNGTVLHYAVAHPELLKILLKESDIVSLINEERTDDGYAPIHAAAKEGRVESVKILIDNRAHLNVLSENQSSPLHCAVSSQNLGVIKLLLDNCRELIVKVNDNNETPLHTAAYYSSSRVVEYLLKYEIFMTSDIDYPTPLHIAACHGHLETVKLLLKHKPSLINHKDKDGETPLFKACSNGKTDVVKFLLDNKADISNGNKVTSKDYVSYFDAMISNGNKDTAMAMMCHERWKEIMETTKHGPEATMKKLISQGMSEVAYQALVNSETHTGDPESKNYEIKYDFMCLQKNNARANGNVKPLTAIEAMVKSGSYKCLQHPVCCKYLKEKWKAFGFKVYLVGFLIYVVFLVSLNVYAFKIPSYEESINNQELPDASITVMIAMSICLVSAGFQTMKEICQLVLNRESYLRDPVNYLEWTLFISTFIFTAPINDNISVKTSLQWKACSVALFCAWMNLIMYFRRFAYYGIVIQMMRKIFVTLIKVLSLLLFFFVAFAAAFTVILNDREGFGNFRTSMLTTAIMTIGEIDFKETFLRHHYYNMFYPTQIVLFVVFVVVMPVVIMNLILALAIEDVSKIKKDAKLRKHIHTANMIINLERKKFIFSYFTKKEKPLKSPLVELPNKEGGLSNFVDGIIFYDFSSDKEDVSSEQVEKNEDLVTLIKMIKELQIQNAKVLKKSKKNSRLIKNISRIEEKKNDSAQS